MSRLCVHYTVSDMYILLYIIHFPRYIFVDTEVVLKLICFYR